MFFAQIHTWLVPSGLRSLHKDHLFNGAFSGHPTYNRLKNMASILVHPNIGTPHSCGTSPKVHLISDMAGSRGSNDIFEALSPSLHFLDTTRLISPESRDSLFWQQFQTTPGVVSTDHSWTDCWTRDTVIPHCGPIPLDRVRSRVNPIVIWDGFPWEPIIIWDGFPWERRVLLPREQR